MGIAAEFACIICNWDNSIWGPLFGGAGVATAAVGGLFGGTRDGSLHASDGSSYNPESEHDSDDSGADQTPPDDPYTRRRRSFQPDSLIDPIANAFRNWAEDTFGPDWPGQTVAGTSYEGGGGYPSTDADDVGRDYEKDRSRTDWAGSVGNRPAPDE